MTCNQPRRPARWSPLLVAVVGIATLASCGGGVKEPAADDPAFEGLSPAIIQEVQDMPYTREQLYPEQWDIQDSYNAQIAWFGYLIQVCRDYLDVYQQWTRTGQAPTAPSAPQVTWEGYRFTLADEASAALESGDPAQLLETVAGPESCGAWVPVTSGSTQSIRQFLIDASAGSPTWATQP